MDSLRLISIIGIVLYFAVLLFIVLKEKKSKTVLDFFFAGRTLPFWVLSITFIASWWGAASAISTADLAYEDGIGAFWYYGVPVLISTLILIFFSKYIRRVGYLTQGKMIEVRYSKLVAKFLSVFIVVFMTVTAASQMVGIGDLLAVYLGWNYEVSVLVGTLVVLVYSAFGGFRGVVLTDIFQFVLLLVSAFAIFFVAYNASGGWDVIMARSEELGRVDFANIFSGFEKYSVYVITFGCSWVIQANVWQRISATKDSKDAKKMSIMSFFAFIPLYLIVVLAGMAAIALYDKLPVGGVVPAIIMDHMHPVFGALVFVGISAAIMSTMDALINTGAMTIAMDLSPDNGNEQRQLRISRFSTVLVVFIGLLIALRIRSILEISWIASDIITTGLFVPIVAGFFWKRGTSKGAIASMIVGTLYCLCNLLIRFGLDIPVFWKQDSAEQVLIGIGMSIVFYVSVSLLTNPEYDKAERFMEKLKSD